MPTFLSDPPSSVFLLLAVVVLIAGAVWVNRRTRKSLIVFLCALGLVGIVVLIDFLVESPREQSVRHVQGMIQAADARDPATFLTHVGDTVHFELWTMPKTLTRDEVRKHSFWDRLNAFKPRIVAWDVRVDEATPPTENAITLGFMAKGEAQGQIFPVCFRATFSRQADGQFKLTRIASFNAVNHQERLVLPE